MVVAPVGVAPAGVSPVGVSPAGVSPGPLGPPDRGQTWWPWRCSGSNACKKAFTQVEIWEYIWVWEGGGAFASLQNTIELTKHTLITFKLYVVPD